MSLRGLFANALPTLMPPAEQELLLAACLSDGPAAAQSWSQFVAAVGDAKSYFESNETGLKGLLPFVECRLAANGVDAGKSFHTYARVALVREELRGNMVAQILDDLIKTASGQGLRFLLIKGAAVDATAYRQPSFRHIHAIDLLVDPRDWSKAQALLRELRFESSSERVGATHHLNFKHWTGLATGLHSRAFFLPHFQWPDGFIESRARDIEIRGRQIRVMSPEDMLVHVGGHAIYARSRSNLRWVCDIVSLLKSNPSLDWQRVVDSADAAGLAPAISTQLRWISRRLYPVPQRWLDELQVRCQRTSSGSAEGYYAALLHSTQSRRKPWHALGGNWRAQLGFLHFSLLPSLRYMRWKHNVDSSWRTIVHYADRPRRLARRLIQVRA